MHELSIVEALIEQVGREVHRAGQNGKILGIELSIGRLSGVNCDSIKFAFELLAAGSIVEGSEITIHEVKPSCRCHTCNSVEEIDEMVFQCPKCKSDAITIEGGRDLLLQSIDVADQQSVESG